MNWIFIAVVIVAWIYILNVLDRAKLEFWRYMAGSMGLFIILMITLREHITMPLARCVAAMG